MSDLEYYKSQARFKTSPVKNGILVCVVVCRCIDHYFWKIGNKIVVTTDEKFGDWGISNKTLSIEEGRDHYQWLMNHANPERVVK